MKKDFFKLSFAIDAGILQRKSVKEMLNSCIRRFKKEKVCASFTEEKYFLSSVFYFKATDIPELLKEDVKIWIKKLEAFC